MAQFRGVINGKAKNNATQLGSKKSGLSVWGDGWNIGAEVELHYNEEKDRDELRVYLTEGSIGRGRVMTLGYFMTNENKEVVNEKGERVN
jgi:hypothetical protein